MRFILHTAVKDLRRRLADPAALLLWIGLPLLVGGFMALLAGGGGPSVKAQLLVVDEDNSMASRFLVGASRQGRLHEFLDVAEVTIGDGRRRIDAGDGSALLVIPKGFQDGILNEQPTVLTLLTNPSQQILPAIVEEGLAVTAEGAFYLQRLFGKPIRAMTEATRGQAPTDDAVAAISRQVNQSVTRLASTLDGPVIRLETRREGEPSAAADAGSLFLPGLLLMSLLFMANGMSFDIWLERDRGTLGRAVSTPHRMAAFLGGKLVATVILTACVSLVALVIAIAAFDVHPIRAAAALVWACYAGAALFCYLVLVQVSARHARTAAVLSQMVVLPLMMIGGSFFPFDLMPGWMAAIGRWTPNGLAVARVRDILFGRPDLSSIAVAAIGLGVPAVLAFALAVRRMRGPFLVN